MEVSDRSTVQCSNITSMFRRPLEKSLNLDSLRLEIIESHLSLIQMNSSKKLLFSSIPLFQSIFQMLPFQPTNQYDPVLHMLYCYSDILTSAQLISIHKIPNENTAQLALKPFNESLMSLSDPLCMWDDLFSWRSTFCSVLLHSEASNSLKRFLNPASYILRLVSVARKQNVPTVAADYLKLVCVDPRDVSVMLARWTERAKITIALKLKNSSVFSDFDGISMESLSGSQTAGVLNLQGKYRLIDDKKEEAIAFFRKAVQADGNNISAWENLSDLYYEQWSETQDTKVAQHCIAFCMNVFMRKVGDFKTIDRFLHIVLSSLDQNQTALIDSKTLLSISDAVWLWYLPFLFSYPSEAQFSFFTPVIHKLILKYPQIVFYPLTVLAMNAGMTTTDYNLMQTTFLSGSVEGSAVLSVRFSDV